MTDKYKNFFHLLKVKMPFEASLHQEKKKSNLNSQNFITIHVGVSGGHATTSYKKQTSLTSSFLLLKVTTKQTTKALIASPID